MILNQPTDPRRRGIALIFTIVLMVFVGLAMATMSHQFASDVRLTRTDLTEAQLRQLLLAGQILARAQLDAGPPDAAADPQPIPLPPELDRDGYTLTLRLLPDEQADADRAVVLVDAAGPKARLQQTLIYVREDGDWTLVDAVMEKRQP